MQNRKSSQIVKCAAFPRSLVETLEPRQLLATLVVTSNSDLPAPLMTTLRQAIASANLNPGADTITFNIPGAPTIHLLTPLPDVTGPTTIDGSTQPGYAGSPVVFVDGSTIVPLMTSINGLHLTGGASTVNALAISGFDSGNSTAIRLSGSGSHHVQNSYIGAHPTGTPPGTARNFDGITVDSNNNVITGNLISNNFDIAVPIFGDGTVITGNLVGTDATGTAAFPNGDAIVVEAASNTRIGGTSAAERNVISGNTNDAIRFEGAGNGNVVLGNFIGTSADGETLIANNGRGVAVEAASTPESTDLMIGGTTAGSRNVISGSDGNGVDILDVSGVRVLGNYIGTDAAGATAIPNSGNGVFVSGEANSTTISGNLISGNLGDGVFIESPSTGNILTSNLIGTDASGTAALGNAGDGVRIDSSDNQIGTPTAGNSIGYNGFNGVTVVLDPANVRNAIRGDNIFYNGGLGIDLGDDGVTPNDPEDPDTGPNEFQNFPVLTAVSLSGNTATISGTLNSTPSSTFVIDFFASQIWDTSTFGEGQQYLGSTTVTTDASGNASFTATVSGVPSGFNYFAATATDSVGNTSEFCYDPTPGEHPTKPAPATAHAAKPHAKKSHSAWSRIQEDDDAS
jgi:parallel beta-helix repeat protein